MSDQNAEKRRRQLETPRRRDLVLFLLVGAVLIGVLALCPACTLVKDWNITQYTGYVAAIIIFAIGFFFPWIPKTHLVHHQICRIMVYCALFIFVLTLCYSMSLDLMSQRQDRAETKKTDLKGAVSGETSRPITSSGD